jgi:hypothetical protein
MWHRDAGARNHRNPLTERAFLKIAPPAAEKRAMRRPRLLSFAPFLLAAALPLACGKDKRSNGNGDGGIVAKTPAPHGESVRVLVLSPTTQSAITTVKATIDLAGVALGGATAVRWSGPGGSGTADGTAQWSAKAIPLVPGDNKIVLKADAPAGAGGSITDTTILVKRNTFLGVHGRPAVSPEAGFVGDPTDVIATVALDMTGDADPASLVVARTDAHGDLVMAAQMFDDGDFAHSGDEIPGDGVYAGRFSISKAQVGQLTLSVQAKDKTGAATEAAEMGNIDFVAHMTDAEYMGAAALANDMQHAMDGKMTSGLTAAYGAALDVANQDPNVAASGVSHEGSGAWAVTNSGVIVAAGNPHDDERGGVEVGNHVLWAGSPYAAELGDADEAKEAAAALAASACPAYDPLAMAGAAGTAAYLDDAVTLDKLRGMTKAGVIVLTTHGTTFDETYAGTPVLDVHEFLATGEVVTPEAREKWELNLKTHRMAIGPAGADGKQRFLVSAKYIRSLGRFPGSLVYAGACRSYYLGELAAAFIEGGAAAYLGYTDMVKKSFAYSTGKALFQCLLTGQHAGGGAAQVADCFDPTKDDGGSTDARGVKFSDGKLVDAKHRPASLRLLGRGDLTLASVVGLANGGFEEIDEANPANGAPLAWRRAGDARAMSALGGYVPSEGARMGLISTGLGFSQSNGELAQTFCIPPGAKTLSYDWNFISAEFKSYCGNPKYQDNLKVTLEPRGGEPAVVQAVKIDDLCATVGDSKFKVPDVGYMDGDMMTYATGWARLAPFDVSAYAGTNKPVTLRFALADVGDSIYDTVVLLDGLKLE